MSEGSRLTRQVAGSALANVWLVFLGLFTTPYLLTNLGSAAYGVLAMVGLVSGHLSNLEFGFGHATVRYLARARAAGDAPRERAILETSFAVFLAAGLVGSLVLFAAAPFLVFSFFHIDAALRGEALVAFRLGAIILGCSFLSSFFSSVLQALGRFVWLNWSRAVLGTCAAAVAVLSVATGGGIQVIFIAQAVLALLANLTLGLALARIRGAGVRPKVESGAFREMGGYGLLLFVSGIAYQWMVNGPPVVLAAHVDAAEIPPFSVPHVILQKLTILVTSASVAFFPFASAASALADRSRLAAVFESHLRLTILVMGPMASYLTVFASTLLGAWVSPAFGAAAAPCLRLLAAAAFLLALSGPPADVARGLGRPGWVLAYTSFVALLGLATSVAVIPSHGPVGAAFALFLGVFVGTIPLLFGVARRLLGLSARDLARALTFPSGAVLLVTGFYAAGAIAAPGVIGAVVTGGLATAVYGAAVFLWILDPRERQALQRVAVGA